MERRPAVEDRAQHACPVCVCERELAWVRVRGYVCVRVRVVCAGGGGLSGEGGEGNMLVNGGGGKEVREFEAGWGGWVTT